MRPVFREDDDYCRHISRDYHNREFVLGYENDRFGTPFGKVLHSNQIGFIQGCLTTCESQLILEIAPGPFRIAKDLGRCCQGIQLDSSRPMLVHGRERCRSLGLQDNWDFLIGTGYDIPLRTGIFDVVLAFRFLWHFEKGHRIHLLREFRRVLKQNGSVIYDFPSSRRVDEKEMNASAGSNIASYALSPLSLKEEAESVGLSVRRITGNMSLSWVTKYISGLHRLRCESLAIRVIEKVSRRNIGSPEEWLVCCGTM